MRCFKTAAAVLKLPALRGGGEAAGAAVHTPLQAAGSPQRAVYTILLSDNRFLCLTLTAGLILRKSPRDR